MNNRWHARSFATLFFFVLVFVLWRGGGEMSGNLQMRKLMFATFASSQLLKAWDAAKKITKQSTRNMASENNCQEGSKRKYGNACTESKL